MADAIPGKRLAELDFVADARGAEVYGEKSGQPGRLKVGEPNGLQTLGPDGKVPVEQIPASIAELREDLADAGGGSLVAFQQSGTGMPVRSMLSKGRDIVHADDRGLVGSGIDETVAVQNLLDAAAGKVLMLGAGKTYGIDTATGLNIPANTTLITNGSKFKRMTALVGSATDASYNIVVNSNTMIDRLEVDCVGGFNDISGVLIAGSNVEIGTLKINTPIPRTAANGTAWVGARIGPNSGIATLVNIGRIVADNFDRAYQVQNIKGGSIGYADITRYRRGLYIKDCKDFAVNGGHIAIASTGSTGKAGENGILIESATAHYSCERIRISNVTVEDAGEHGFRLGGQFIMRDIWHLNCLSRGAGAGNGVAPPPDDDDHGGCGFKVLGPTSVNGARHQNIYYSNCTAEALVLDSLTDRHNFAGFQIGKCYNVNLDNCTVRPTIPATGYTGPTAYSCLRGIEVLGCENATINNPNITAAKTAGIMLYDAENAGGIEWGVQTNVKITGGMVSLPLSADACVEVRCLFNNMRRVTIDGLLCDGGANAIKCTVSGTGVITAPTANITTWNQTTETLNGCGSWTIQGKGQFVGTSACLNGSSFNSWTAGAFRVMKAGAWTSL